MSDSSKQLHDAFRNTLSAYQEAAGASGTIKAIDYSDPQAGKASYTVRTSMIPPQHIRLRGRCRDISKTLPNGW